MFQGNYSGKEIRDMILSLKFEGWESNQHIPGGWICKEKSVRSEQGLNIHIVSISIMHSTMCTSKSYFELVSTIVSVIYGWKALFALIPIV